MELILAMIFMAIMNKRHATPRETLCVHCDMFVHVEHDHWVHENGQKYMPYPDLETVIMHPASPSSTFLS